MSKTYLDFEQDLTKINSQLDIKMSELTKAQKEFNDIKFEYDNVAVKKQRLTGKFNLKLRRELQDKEVVLNRARNNISVLDAEITRLQDERQKIRQMFELSNTQAQSKNINASMNGNQLSSDDVIKAKMLENYSNKNNN